MIAVPLCKLQTQFCQTTIIIFWKGFVIEKYDIIFEVRVSFQSFNTICSIVASHENKFKLYKYV